MKKLIIPLFIIVLFPLLYLVYNEIQTTQLLPQVKKILDVPAINEKNMELNAYVHFLAITSESKDYLPLAKQYLIQNNQLLRKALKINYPIKQNDWPTIEGKLLKENKTINGLPYISPCRNLQKVNCIAALIKLEAPLTKLVKEHDVLLTRYNKIISLPLYQPYYQATLFTHINTKLYFFLSELNQFQAVLAIKQGNVIKGFKLLQQEIDFAKKLYTSQDAFIDKEIASQTLLTIYHTISSLLDEPELTSAINNPKLMELLNTLPSQDELNLKLAIAYDQYSKIYQYALATDPKEILNHPLNELKQLTNQQNIPLTFDSNKTLNHFYLSYKTIESIIDSTNLNPTQGYLKLKSIVSESNCDMTDLSFGENFVNKVDKQNVLGDYIFCGNDPAQQLINIINGLYNVQSYLALIKLKLEINQKAITAEQIPTFLTNAGDNAINPYTQKPFVWDKENSLLSTDWLSTNEHNAQQVFIQLKFNTLAEGE